MGNKESFSTLKIVIFRGEDKLPELIFPFSVQNEKFKQISEIRNTL